MNELLAPLWRLLGLEDGAEEALLTLLRSQAEAEALAITRRKVLPEALKGAVLDLAVLRWNRRGLEGESERAEGGVTSRMEALPEDLRRQLRSYTLAKAGVGKCGEE